MKRCIAEFLSHPYPEANGRDFGEAKPRGGGYLLSSPHRTDAFRTRLFVADHEYGNTRIARRAEIPEAASATIAAEAIPVTSP
jgi:hypothetical protein